MSEERVKRESYLDRLRSLFDDMQKARMLRRLGGNIRTPKGISAKARKKLAGKKAWAAAQKESIADVAVCPRCPAWFPTTAERNHHRASACPNRPRATP